MACSLDSKGSCNVTPMFASNDRSVLYNGFVQYFGDLVMTKIQSKDPTYSLYVARVLNLLGDKQYIYCVCPNDFYPTGSTIYLSSLRWVSLQARTSKTEHDLTPQRIVRTNNPVLFSPIKYLKDTEDYCVYSCYTYPLEITVFGKTLFHDEGTLQEAVEVFNTVIVLK